LANITGSPYPTPYRNSPLAARADSQKLLENMFFGLEEANRSFRDVSEIVASLRHENHSLRQENQQLAMQLKSLTEKPASTSAASDEETPVDSRKVDALISRYLPAIQLAISETLARALNDLKNELNK
jgi:regulator of replication initiation timing